MQNYYHQSSPILGLVLIVALTLLLCALIKHDENKRNSTRRNRANRTRKNRTERNW